MATRKPRTALHLPLSSYEVCLLEERGLIAHYISRTPCREVKMIITLKAFRQYLSGDGLALDWCNVANGARVPVSREYEDYILVKIAIVPPVHLFSKLCC